MIGICRVPAKLARSDCCREMCLTKVLVANRRAIDQIVFIDLFEKETNNRPRPRGQIMRPEGAGKSLFVERPYEVDVFLMTLMDRPEPKKQARFDSSAHV